MYYYIYDSFLENSKYRKIVDRIELRLADLGITGDIARVRPLRDIEEIVLEGLNLGKRTIITLGNDYTFSKVANTILNQGKVSLSEITCGFIPADKPNSIGESLGIPIGEEACDVISRRILKNIDLGRIKKDFFFTKAVMGFGGKPKDIDKNGNLSYWKALRFKPREVILKLDNKFRIRADLFQASMVNLSSSKEAKPLSNPEDGFLNVFVTSKFSKLSFLKNLKLLDKELYYSLPRTSIFKARRIEIVSPQKKVFNILADNRKIARSPVVIEVAPRKLKVIVGKRRTF